ncbi:hypothetical protein [Nesterenkonia pannonica]|uniref:hypothetical protein n=1 Tax=Nesterenkonia pannonica TaxID=1548602 RepID=UPI002164A50F|nr:hypothetical protein [Nesterenkonia pannonica]
MTRFISQALLGEAAQANYWEERELLGHREMIAKDAKHLRRLAVKKVVSSFVLERSGTIVGGIDGQYTTLVSYLARKAAESPVAARHHLQAAELPMLDGRAFHASQKGLADRYVAERPGPVTLRPASPQAKRGISVAVRPGAEFEEAWRHADEAVADRSRASDRWRSRTICQA